MIVPIMVAYFVCTEQNRHEKQIKSNNYYAYNMVACYILSLHIYNTDYIYLDKQ